MRINVRLACHALIVVAVTLAPQFLLASHDEVQTNAILRAMLENHLHRVCFEAETGVSREAQLPVCTTEAFFAGDSDWPAADRRAAFDWYLSNLSSTCRHRGVLKINPLARAAVRQCIAMGYTNAVDRLKANALGRDDGCRQLEIEAVIKLSPCSSELVSFIRAVGTNTTVYTSTERSKAIGGLFQCLERVDNGSLCEENFRASALDLIYNLRYNVAFGRMIDDYLCRNRTGYAMNASRLAVARSMLEAVHSMDDDERSLFPEREHFWISVTNELSAVTEPAPGSVP